MLLLADLSCNQNSLTCSDHWLWLLDQMIHMEQTGMQMLQQSQIIKYLGSIWLGLMSRPVGPWTHGAPLSVEKESALLEH